MRVQSFPADIEALSRVEIDSLYSILLEALILIEETLDWHLLFQY